jgi:hypothetical protein
MKEMAQSQLLSQQSKDSEGKKALSSRHVYEINGEKTVYYTVVGYGSALSSASVLRSAFSHMLLFLLLNLRKDCSLSFFFLFFLFSLL